MVLLACKSLKLKHVVCHRKQVYIILKDTDSHLNMSLSFDIGAFINIVFVTLENVLGSRLRDISSRFVS